MDKELFELCKEVYQRTQWNKTEFLWVAPPLNDKDYEIMHKSVLHDLNDYVKHPEMIDKMYNSTFCYDSDYLLEKLPWSTVCSGPNEGMFGAWMKGQPEETFNEAETPLKALLKLTLALHEAGQLS